MGFIFAALASATAYGVADLAGGLAARRLPVLIVVLIANVLAALVLSVMAVGSGDFSLSQSDLGDAFIAGLAMSIAGLFLYKALAIGPMSVAAPITAVTAIAFPVLYGFSQGHSLSAMQLSAIIVAVVAIILCSDDRSPSRKSTHSNRWNTIGLAVAAGIGISIFYIFFERLSDVAGLWPLAIARYASLTSLLAIVGISISLRRLKPHSFTPIQLWMPSIAGLSDAVAILFYFEAVRHGPIALVVTLSSLYPVVTVALAVAFLKETPTARQWAGGVAALVAILVLASS